MNDVQYQEAFARAKKKVEARIGFYKHLISYVLVNLFLLAVNLITSPGALWFYWPLLGWGIALASHGLRVFVFSGEDGLEPRMIRKEMEKENKKKS